MAVITKTIKTDDRSAENTSRVAKSYGSNYSAFHSKIDSAMQDKVLADRIYSILKEAKPKQRIKLSEEELAEYYGGENKSTEGTVSETKPREYGIFK